MIQELIEAKVNAMDANSMTYNFLHADVEWQNLEADNEILPAVFMDMPVQFTPIVKVGGAYERKYSVNVLFLFKSNLDDNADQRYSSLKLAENAQRQFHLMIDNDDVNFKGVEVGQCFQVMNFLDCNLDGIVMPFTFTERNSDSVCIPSSDPVCRPVTYLIKDEDDNILYSGNVASGGALIKAIQNGQVKNSLGTVLGSILAEGEITLDDVDNIDSDGSTVPTPAGVAFTCTPVAPCSDATAVLKDEDGNTISTTNIPSGDSEDIEAPNATYDVKYENGTLIENGEILSNGYKLIEVPDPISCANADLTLNGDAFLSVASGSDTDIELLDQDDNEIDPLSVVGSVIKVTLPAPTYPSVGATLIKTGQTSSVVTGDDGDLQNGREDDFLTLESVPVHTDGSATINTTTSRFTDELGGQTYANSIFIDWSTYNNITGEVLGFFYNYFNAVESPQVIWGDFISDCNSFSKGSFVSGWYAPNAREMFNLVNQGTNQAFNYAPFNINSGYQFWTSTNAHNDPNPITGSAKNIASVRQSVEQSNKASLYFYMPCRKFTVTGTTLT